MTSFEPMRPGNKTIATACLQGGGDMGARMRAFDWPATSLGPVERWPSSLRFAVALILRARHPMMIFWGPDHIQFYNDAFQPSLGLDKRATSLGQRGHESWADIWPVVGPQIDSVMRGGPSTWAEDVPFHFERNGVVEEVNWTYGYSPLLDDDGAVGGTLVICSETTAQVVGPRRLRTLRDLGAIPGGTSLEEDCRALIAVLGLNPSDIPFAVLYVDDPGGQSASLAAACGIEPGHPCAPQKIDLTEGSPFFTGALDRHLATIEIPSDALPGGPWPEARCRAVLVPIFGSDERRSRDGVLVAGVNPRLRLDERYCDFFALVGDQLEATFARAYAHRAADRKRERLYQLFMQAPTAMCVVRGPDLVFEMANPLYCQLVGRDVVGKKLFEGLPELRGQGFDELLLRVMETGVSCVGNDRLMHLDLTGMGEMKETYWNFVYAPMRERDGRIERVMAVCHEVTANVLARQTLEAARLDAEVARNDAEIANAWKDELLVTLSHELLTPVGAIGLWLGVLRKSTDEATRIRAMSSIQMAAASQSRMLDDLFDASRMEKGSLSVERRPIDLGTILNDVVQTAKLNAAAKQLQLSYVAPNGPAPVLGDPARLSQVLANVLGNALKFTPKGGKISVGFARLESTFQITIQDDGEGIPKEFLASAFEPFRQAHTATSKPHGGLGLGLAIVSKLVQLHEGIVRIESEGLGKGATVVIGLPWLASVPDESRGQATKTILIVDDESSIVESLDLLLTTAGYRIVSAANGQEALVRVRAEKPKLVLVDLMMPVVDGRSFVRSLRAMAGFETLPVVMMSAARQHSAVTNGASGREMDGCAFLQKPFVLEDLLALIRRSIGNGEK